MASDRGKRGKFRVGQVVFVLRSQSYRRLVAKDTLAHGCGDYWRDQMGTLWVEAEMRALTARERDPRPAKRRGK